VGVTDRDDGQKDEGRGVMDAHAVYPIRGEPGLSRRALIARAAAAAGLTIGTPLGRLTPAQAHAALVPPTTLLQPEAETLAALGEVLLPGATEAGIVEYVDSQLDAEQPLLMYRYLDVPTPALDFYRASLAALDQYAGDQHGATFAACSVDQQTAIVAALATGTTANWPGPPGPLVYFVLRADALDVVYGTVDGFDRLGVPYLAHIEPAARW
jgi:hypothetical protein